MGAPWLVRVTTAGGQAALVWVTTRRTWPARATVVRWTTRVARCA